MPPARGAPPSEEISAVIVLCFVLAMLLFAAGQRASTPPTVPGTPPATREIDFDRYQHAIDSQNRRMDALEAMLGGLCALEFGAMTYLLDRTEHAELALRLLALCMLLPVVTAFIGWFGFSGEEGPALDGDDGLDAQIHSDRAEALTRALETMRNDYAANRYLIRIKVRLRDVSVTLAATILIVELVSGMVQ
jgi:hypothetical protein